MEKTESPIIFNSEMVRAILDGRKTQTRRIIKNEFYKAKAQCGMEVPTFRGLGANDEFLKDKCPYGKVGDLLWVRETFNCNDYRFPNDAPINELKEELMYRADHNEIYNCFEEKMVWRPSIHMPRWACRITLEITNIRVERLQEISEADAQAEGVGDEDMVNRIDSDILPTAAMLKLPYECDRVWFAHLWNEINGKREGCSWSDNPYVWVIEFKKL